MVSPHLKNIKRKSFIISGLLFILLLTHVKIYAEEFKRALPGRARLNSSAYIFAWVKRRIKRSPEMMKILFFMLFG